MIKEYEYSLKVKDIKPFINYCIDNNYKLENEYKQIRVLYKNDGKIMARITKNIYKDQTVELLNFKDDKLDDSILKVRRETEDLVINSGNRKFIKSLLEFLELKEEKKLIRKRFVYKKNNVIFEIDNYTSPKMMVVAIEGLKKEVDKVYNELKNIIDDNKIE